MVSAIQTRIVQNFPERECWMYLASKRAPVYTQCGARYQNRAIFLVQVSAWVQKLRQSICGEYGVQSPHYLR
jgi:hypothetical protein